MVTEMTARADRFRDQVVIVSGAMGGIGLATAKRFAREGARLVLVDLKQTDDRFDAATRDCQALGSPQTLCLECDVSDEAQVKRATDLAVQRFGRLDVIANVAALMMFKPMIELTGADWQRVLGVCLMGAVYFTREGLRLLPRGGAIVNVSSVHAIQTSPLVAPYAAAKAAMLSLTRSTAIEGKPKGIRANAILPGAIDTPMLWTNPNIASGAEKIAPEDVGTPEQIASIIAFLASQEAAFVTGSAFTADGGRMAFL